VPISSSQFGSGSSSVSNFNAPADTMGSTIAAARGADRSSSGTVGSMGNPLALRTAGVGGFGGGFGGIGAGGLRTFNK
jgi:hypothetical protein